MNTPDHTFGGTSDATPAKPVGEQHSGPAGEGVRPPGFAPCSPASISPDAPWACERCGRLFPLMELTPNWNLQLLCDECLHPEPSPEDDLP